jgi:integrase
MLIRVEQGKGAKDRYAMLSPRLLQVLRRYAKAARPTEYLFPSWRANRHLCPSSLQLACREAAALSGIRKRITAHTLRHYAASGTMPRVGVRAVIHGHLNNGDAA